jgi:hypothetical protein
VPGTLEFLLQVCGGNLCHDCHDFFASMTSAMAFTNVIIIASEFTLTDCLPPTTLFACCTIETSSDVGVFSMIVKSFSKSEIIAFG